MASDFIETMQKVEDVSRALAKMGGITIEEAVKRIEAIGTFIDRYGDLALIFARFKELESKLYMIRELFTVEEAADYLGVSKSQVYLMTSTREISHYKPNGKVIYIERKELDDLRRRNLVQSKRELGSYAAAAVMSDGGKRGKGKKGGTK